MISYRQTLKFFPKMYRAVDFPKKMLYACVQLSNKLVVMYTLIIFFVAIKQNTHENNRTICSSLPLTNGVTGYISNPLLGFCKFSFFSVCLTSCGALNIPEGPQQIKYVKSGAGTEDTGFDYFLS